MIDPRDVLEARCTAQLGALGIAFTLRHHPPVYTVEEARLHRNEDRGAHIKNLFICDRRKERFALITVLESRRVDLRALGAVLGIPRPRFANAEDLAARLGVEPGSVTPLAAMHPGAEGVVVVVDEGLRAFEEVNVHPLHNAATLTLAVADLLRFLEAVGRAPRLLAIDEERAPLGE